MVETQPRLSAGKTPSEEILNKPFTPLPDKLTATAPNDAVLKKVTPPAQQTESLDLTEKHSSHNEMDLAQLQLQ